jgi:hypothetical protein
LTGDGVIDAADYITLKRNMGTDWNTFQSSQAPGVYDCDVVSSGTVPEPTTLALAAAAGAAIGLKGTGRRASKKRRQKQEDYFDALESSKPLHPGILLTPVAPRCSVAAYA